MGRNLKHMRARKFRHAEGIQMLSPKPNVMLTLRETRSS